MANTEPINKPKKGRSQGGVRLLAQAELIKNQSKTSLLLAEGKLYLALYLRSSLIADFISGPGGPGSGGYKITSTSNINKLNTEYRVTAEFIMQQRAMFVSWGGLEGIEDMPHHRAHIKLRQLVEIFLAGNKAQRLIDDLEISVGGMGDVFKVDDDRVVGSQ